MAASDHVNDQLKMFMSPREIGGYVDHYSDFPSSGPVSGLPHQVMGKIDDGQVQYRNHAMDKTGMGASIDEDGVKKPIVLSRSTERSAVVNGHNRLLRQSQADPDRLMPVIHDYIPPDLSDRFKDRTAAIRKTFGDTEAVDPTGDKR